MLAARVLPSATVKVEEVAGGVIVILFTLVAVATPIVGVVKVGEVANTSAPLPVLSLITPANCADVVLPKNPRLLDARARRLAVSLLNEHLYP